MRKKHLGAFLLLSVLVTVAIVLIYKPATQINIDIGDFEYGGDKEGEIIEIRRKGSPGSPGLPTPPYPPFERYSLARGVEEIAKVCGKAPMLPTWLPDGMRFAEVYMGPVAIISFSDRKVSDFRFANVTIEMKRELYPGSLSPEELKKSEELWKQHGWEDDLKLMQIRDIWAVLMENASLGDPEVEAIFGLSPLAWFWYDEYYYIICAKSPLTLQDLINIIEALEPVG